MIKKINHPLIFPIFLFTFAHVASGVCPAAKATFATYRTHTYLILPAYPSGSYSQTNKSPSLPPVPDARPAPAGRQQATARTVHLIPSFSCASPQTSCSTSPPRHQSNKQCINQKGCKSSLRNSTSTHETVIIPKTRKVHPHPAMYILAAMCPGGSHVHACPGTSETQERRGAFHQLQCPLRLLAGGRHAALLPPELRWD